MDIPITHLNLVLGVSENGRAPAAGSDVWSGRECTAWSRRRAELISHWLGQRPTETALVLEALKVLIEWSWKAAWSQNDKFFRTNPTLTHETAHWLHVCAAKALEQFALHLAQRLYIVLPHFVAQSRHIRFYLRVSVSITPCFPAPRVLRSPPQDSVQHQPANTNARQRRVAPTAEQ
eukprot:1176674-Prorocentrum_minimum.AAC.4